MSEVKEPFWQHGEEQIGVLFIEFQPFPDFLSLLAFFVWK